MVIEDIEHKDLFVGSKTKLFDLVKDSLSGASDIDLCYERHGNILILESKLSDGKYFRMKLGQWIMLKALNIKPNVFVKCIAELTNGTYKIFNLQSVEWKDDILDEKFVIADIKDFENLSRKDLNKALTTIVGNW